MNPLNTLVNKCGMTSTSIIPVSKLKQQYQPSSCAEFLTIINQHGKKTLDEVAQYCYDNQAKFIDQHFSYSSIYAYCYDLFVVKTLGGFAKEQTALKHLVGYFPSLLFKTDTRVDCQYSVDIVVGVKGKFIAGIQVKPESYQNLTSTDKKTNVDKNTLFTSKFNAPVFYLYYNTNTGHFSNMKYIQDELNKM